MLSILQGQNAWVVVVGQEGRRQLLPLAPLGGIGSRPTTTPDEAAAAA